MTTSKNAPKRRRRFEAGAAKFGMTPAKGRLLYHVATCGMLTTAQLIRLSGMGKSGAYKHLRDLKDHKMVETHSAPFADFAPTDSPDARVSWAPGPDIFVASKAGIKWLLDMGYIDSAADVPEPTVPTRGLFLAHEVLVKDARVWLEMCAQRPDSGKLTYWVDGDEAHFSMVRPDGWFLFKMDDGRTLVGMVEADRGTMRGERMADKAKAYRALDGSQEFKDATHGRTAFRVVVVTLDANRRDRIVGDMAMENVFAASVTDLQEPGLERAVWRTMKSADLVPLTWKPA